MSVTEVVLSPAEQAELTLSMCEMMGYSFEDACAAVDLALAEQRADPEWREIWDRQRAVTK